MVVDKVSPKKKNLEAQGDKANNKKCFFFLTILYFFLTWEKIGGTYNNVE